MDERSRSLSDPDLTEYAASGELWARPPDATPVDGQHLLSVHSATVAERTADALVDIPIATVAGRETEFGRIIGQCHDFGKLSVWFQRWLRDEIGAGDKRRYHAGLGALLTMFALDQRGFDTVAQALGWAVVDQHHSPMPDMPDLVDSKGTVPRDPTERRQITETHDRYDEQVSNIAGRVPESASAMIADAAGGAGSLDGFREYVSERRFVEVLGNPEIRHSIHTALYGDVLAVYTALKFGDSSHSAGIADADLLQGEPLDHDALIAYRNDFDARAGVQGEFDDFRDQAQETVSERASLLCTGADASHVGTIWLPTGFGKTIAGLDTALTIAEEAAKDGPIIYTLPFTSILDQTVGVIEDIFDADLGSSKFVLHHYLADTKVHRGQDSADQPTDERLEYLLGESWRAGCVLTTFVQLFESILAPTASQATKVPALADSVIIIDEPQELPPRLWPLLSRLIEILTDRFGAHVLMMTATQPRFFREHSDHDVVDLIDDTTPYTDFLRRNPRVSYRLHPSVVRYIEADDASCEDVLPLSHGDAAAEIAGALTGEAQSALAVCNTISSARTLHDDIRFTLENTGRSIVSPALIYDRLLRRDDCAPSTDMVIDALTDAIADDNGDGDPIVALHLTARHRPPDRRLLIETLTGTDNTRGMLDRDIPVVVTSTRLIEAGVDIGCDHVYRDIAQVTSLVQSGGRCNREFDAGDGGTVTVWRLGEIEEADDENGEQIAGRTPASYIYGGGASGGGGMAQTRAALRGRGSEIAEAEMITSVVEEFFGAMRSYGFGDERHVNAINRADTDALRDVSLIEDTQHLTDTIVTRTSSERATAVRLRDELIKDPADRDQATISSALDDLANIRYGTPAPDDDAGLATSSYTTLTDSLLWLDASASEYNPELGVVDI